MLTPAELKAMPEYDAWFGRMNNWKFSQAYYALPDNADDFVKDSTEALSKTFGDIGWVLYGSMADVIRLAVGSLVGWDE